MTRKPKSPRACRCRGGCRVCSALTRVRSREYMAGRKPVARPQRVRDDAKRWDELEFAYLVDAMPSRL